jgi:hypothetical protein
VDGTYTSSSETAGEVPDVQLQVRTSPIHRVGLIAVAVSLASCGGGGGGGPVSIPAPLATPASLMTASDWQIGPVINGKNYSHNVSLHRTADADGWHIDLPQSDGVHYVTRHFGSLAGKTRITIRYRVEIADGAKIVPSSSPGGTAVGPVLYFQRNNDDWNTDSYRWWATFNAPVPIVPGTFEMSATLNDNWASVMGKTAAQDPTGFADAKQNADQVGFTLGGGTGYGHGVYAVGQARIVVTDFRID